MTKKTTSPDLSADIAAKIKSGELKMKPKAYFILGSVMSGVGLALTLMFSLTTVMIISFRLRRFGLAGLLLPGGKNFLAPLPMMMLLLGVLTFYLGSLLLKKYEITYKHNFWAIVISLLMAILTLGFLADTVGVNHYFQQRPGLKQLYQQQQVTPHSPSGPKVKGWQHFYNLK